MINYGLRTPMLQIPTPLLAVPYDAPRLVIYIYMKYLLGKD